MSEHHHINPIRELRDFLFDTGHRAEQGFVAFIKQYFRALRFYLVTGMLVWVPLIVTVWLTYWLFKNIGLGIENLIERGYGYVNSVGENVERLSFLQEFEYRPGFGFLITVALFLTTGFLARYLVGRRMIGRFERALIRIPGFRGVYRAVQQIRDVFVNRDGTVFERVVVIEYPRPGMYAMAFQTSSHEGVVQRALEKPLTAVFMPTTPNPTSGFLLYVHPEEVIALDLNVEDAMKLIVSGGAFDPLNDHPEIQDVVKGDPIAQPVMPETEAAK